MAVDVLFMIIQGIGNKEADALEERAWNGRVVQSQMAQLRVEFVSFSLFPSVSRLVGFPCFVRCHMLTSDGSEAMGLFVARCKVLKRAWCSRKFGVGKFLLCHQMMSFIFSFWRRGIKLRRLTLQQGRTIFHISILGHFSMWDFPYFPYSSLLIEIETTVIGLVSENPDCVIPKCVETTVIFILMRRQNLNERRRGEIKIRPNIEREPFHHLRKMKLWKTRERKRERGEDFTRIWIGNRRRGFGEEEGEDGLDDFGRG